MTVIVRSFELQQRPSAKSDTELKKKLKVVIKVIQPYFLYHTTRQVLAAPVLMSVERK